MRIYRFPQAAGIDTLELHEATPDQPGRGQILVRMHAASLNYRDLNVAAGRAARGTIPANLVPLSDGAGEVIEVGPEVTRVKVGDRVAGLFMQNWLGGDMEPAHVESSRGGAIDGVLAEYVVFDQDGVVQGHLAARSPRIIEDGRTFSYVVHEADGVRLRITQNDDYERQYPARSLARITLTLRDGSVLTHEVDRSERARYLRPSDADIAAKFRAIAQPVIGAQYREAGGVIAAILEPLERVDELARDRLTSQNSNDPAQVISPLRRNGRRHCFTRHAHSDGNHNPYPLVTINLGHMVAEKTTINRPFSRPSCPRL